MSTSQLLQVPDTCSPTLVGSALQLLLTEEEVDAAIDGAVDAVNTGSMQGIYPLQMLQASVAGEIANNITPYMTFFLQGLLAKQVETVRDRDAVEVPNLSRVGQLVPANKKVDTIPDSLLRCWNLLRESELSGDTFRQIVSIASSRLLRGDQGLRPLSTKTLKAFLNFWELARDQATEPEITISPKGNLQAEWRRDEGNFVVLEFQPSGDIFFSLWQDNYVIEGSKAAKKMRELVHVFGALEDNPLGWSDVA